MKIWSKIGYGMGDLGAGIVWGMVSNYLMIYLTDSVGIAAATVGTIILISRVFDGFSDALMGTIIDRTYTKIGKAKPWYLGSIIPLIVIFVMLFNIPKSMSTTTQQIYVFTLYFILTAIVYTVKDVSYNTLPALIADNTQDRVNLSIWRFVFSLSISIIIGVVIIPIINTMGGISNQVAWSNIVWILATIGGVTLFISAVSAKEITVENTSIEKKRQVNSLPFYKVIGLAFANKYFIIVLISTLAGMMRIAFLGVSIYYVTYVLEDANLMGFFTIASLLPMLIGMFIGNPLVKRFGMQKARTLGNGISLFGALLAAVFSEDFTMVITGISILSLGLGPSTSTNAAMLANIADYGEWKHYVKLQGVTFSCNSMATKIATGLGGAFIGWGLQLGGYVAGASVQSDNTILMIKGIYLYIPVLLCVITLVTNLFLDIEYKMPTIKEELNHRNSLSE